MVRASVDELVRDPAGYLRRVAAGETVLVTQADAPVAEIRPLAKGISSERPQGLAAGEFTVPDDFDAPLPDDLLEGFEGK